MCDITLGISKACRKIPWVTSLLEFLSMFVLTRSLEPFPASNATTAATTATSRIGQVCNSITQRRRRGEGMGSLSVDIQVFSESFRVRELIRTQSVISNIAGQECALCAIKFWCIYILYKDQFLSKKVTMASGIPCGNSQWL